MSIVFENVGETSSWKVDGGSLEIKEILIREGEGGGGWILPFRATRYPLLTDTWSLDDLFYVFVFIRVF